MRNRKKPMRVILTCGERNQAGRQIRCTTTHSCMARRTRMIQGVAVGLPLLQVARLVGMTEK
jgi:hypothetical protein